MSLSFLKMSITVQNQCLLLVFSKKLIIQGKWLLIVAAENGSLKVGDCFYSIDARRCL